MNSGIKAVILDCFGVLYVPLNDDFYRSHIAGYQRHRALLDELSRQAGDGLMPKEDLVRAVSKLSRFNIKGPVSGLVRNEALLQYAQTLRIKYKLGMLSNISTRAMNSFFSPEEREQLFDGVIITSEAGLVKPDPAVFKLAARRLKVEAESAVMVDDSPANCSGAMEAGMRAIVYETFEDMKRRLEDLAIS